MLKALLRLELQHSKVYMTMLKSDSLCNIRKFYLGRDFEPVAGGPHAALLCTLCGPHIFLQKLCNFVGCKIVI